MFCFSWCAHNFYGKNDFIFCLHSGQNKNISITSITNDVKRLKFDNLHMLSQSSNYNIEAHYIIIHKDVERNQISLLIEIINVYIPYK